VVVPTCNNDRTIEACLRSLRSHHHPCRVVVVDNHSSDDTAAIARTLAEAVVTARRERSAQRNRGPRLEPLMRRFDRGSEGWVLSLRARPVGPLARIDALANHEEGRVRHLDACRKKAHFAVVIRRFVAGASIMSEAAIAAGTGT